MKAKMALVSYRTETGDYSYRVGPDGVEPPVAFHDPVLAEATGRSMFYFLNARQKGPTQAAPPLPEDVRKIWAEEERREFARRAAEKGLLDFRNECRRKEAAYRRWQKEQNDKAEYERLVGKR